jgi:hypothetical protein
MDKTKEKLSGLYRVSFDLEIPKDSEVTVTDVVQSVINGFEDPVLSSIANLKVDKVEKNAQVPGVNLKTGDLVRFIRPVKVKATIINDNGYYTIAQPVEGSEIVGETEVELPIGCQATINYVEGNDVELIEFDTVVTVPLNDVDTDEIVATPIGIDFLKLKAEDVVKVADHEDECPQCGHPSDEGKMCAQCEEANEK